jgi:hypothetical protein
MKHITTRTITEELTFLQPIILDTEREREEEEVQAATTKLCL